MLKWIFIRNLHVFNFLHDWSIFESRFDHFVRIPEVVVQTNCAYIGFIFDSLVSISIFWTFFLLFWSFVTSFAYHSWNCDFRNYFENALTLRSRSWEIWVKFGGTCTCTTLFSSRWSLYLSVVCALKTSDEKTVLIFGEP